MSTAKVIVNPCVDSQTSLIDLIGAFRTVVDQEVVISALDVTLGRKPVDSDIRGVEGVAHDGGQQNCGTEDKKPPEPGVLEGSCYCLCCAFSNM